MELNHISHMVGSKCNLKMHVRNLGYLFPLQIEGPPFWRFPNFRATLTAYIFRMKHDIHNREVRWQLLGVSYIMSICHELWSTNCFKLHPNLYPLYVNSVLYFIARVRRRTPANGTQPITKLAKRWMAVCANSVP